MAEFIDGYKITESNGSAYAGQRPSVRVYTPSGQIAAQVHSNTGRLLTRIRKYLHSPERQDLIWQLQVAQVPAEIIEKIVAYKDKRSTHAVHAEV